MASLIEGFTDASPHKYLDTLIRNQDYRVARIVAHKLIDENAKDLVAYRKLIAIEEFEGHTHQAMTCHAQLVERSEDILDVLGWYQRLYQTRCYDALLRHFKTLWSVLSLRLTYPSTESEVWIMALKSALKSRDFDVYEQYATKLSLLEEKTPKYYHIAAAYFLAKHEAELATSILKKGTRFFPDVLSLKLHLGLSAFAKGDKEPAQAYLLEALKGGSSVALTYLLELCPDKNEINQILRMIFVK